MMMSEGRRDSEHSDELNSAKSVRADSSGCLPPLFLPFTAPPSLPDATWASCRASHLISISVLSRIGSLPMLQTFACVRIRER
jgi:hypothetical protein